ncbi:MAG: thermonuclease family protein [Hyphomicrobiaceae bacterium]
MSIASLTKSRTAVALLVAAVLLLAPASTSAGAAGSAGEAGEGCHDMLPIRIVDGDTVYGYIDTSDPEVAVKVKLRIAGIDTPETGARARCEEEARSGKRAKDFLAEMLAEALGSRGEVPARACGLKPDKYHSRRLGRLEIQIGKRWIDVGQTMIEEGFAFPYAGGRRGRIWCDCLQHGSCPSGYRGHVAPASTAKPALKGSLAPEGI